MKNYIDFIDLIKILLPILTFILGIFVHRLFEKQKRKSDTLINHVNIICELANDWFNQLYELNQKGGLVSKQPEMISFHRAIEFYSQNRLVLPRLLKSLEVLKNFSEAEELVDNIKSFLKIVTDYREENLDEHINCLPYITSRNKRRLSPKELTEWRKKNIENLNLFLKESLWEIDAIMQKINIEAGRLIK